MSIKVRRIHQSLLLFFFRVLTCVFQLQYTSGSLVPYLKVDYSSKYNGSYPIDNITKVLNEHLPKMYLTNQDSFIDSVKTDHIQFKPIGEKIHEYTREVKHGNEHFEIYKVKRKKKIIKTNRKI